MKIDFEKMYEEYGGADVKPKWEFIASDVFGFHTYDDELQKKWYYDMMDVIKAMIKRTTYQYQEEKYETYLFMCHMPFLSDKIEWGVSIRGAYIDHYYEQYILDLLKFSES